MARLLNVGGHRVHHLEAQNLVGRSPQMSLRLPASYVSNQHAVLYWSERKWHLKDLSSHNGSWLNGQRVLSGKAITLEPGTRIAFGHPDEVWELADDGPPEVMLVNAITGEQLVVRDPVLGLPSDINPECTLYKSAIGGWILETGDGACTQISDNSPVPIRDHVYRFCCPDDVNDTVTTNVDPLDESPKLEFRVSRDEEFVALRLHRAGGAVELGARSHNHLLLTLARARVRDVADGLPPTSCGWTYKEDLVAGTDSPQRVDNEVFRIRKHLAKADPMLAGQIVERRARTRQLRLGVADIEIVAV